MADWLGLNTWGIALVQWVQSWATGPLVPVFLAITWLGNEQAYLVLLPLLYWCVSRRWGLRLFYLVMLSAASNELLKNLFRLPRPDPRLVRRLVKASGFGLPSGHAQTGGVVLWGYMAANAGRRWLTALAVGMAFLIGLSRLVVGVHFPQDVLAGWLVGSLILGVALSYEESLLARLRRLSPAGQVVLAVLAPLLLLVLIPADHLGRYPSQGAGTLAGVLIGTGVGAIAEQRTVGFSVAGPLWQRLVRYLVGIVIVGAIYVVGSLVPDLTSWALDMAVRVVRYAMTGLAGIWLAPWLFVHLRLAEVRSQLAT